MPGWSPEIANEFIALSCADGRPLDQLRLQALVYIAHGWCLALHNQPLTGDRPEACNFGPVYARLSSALSGYGRTEVTRPISQSEAFGSTASEPEKPAWSELDEFEIELIGEIYQRYALFESWQLSALTRKGESPWKRIFEEGRGLARDIPHNLVKAQFDELLRQSE